jgi:hypothetical protein
LIAEGYRDAPDAGFSVRAHCTGCGDVWTLEQRSTTLEAPSEDTTQRSA